MMTDLKTFNSDGISIAYRDEGAGEPVFLVHGFASNSFINWVYTGWFETLIAAGYRVIAIDNRGHGESEKLYDQGLYESPMMAEDVRRLMDHCSVERAHVMGYSMGARITAFLALNHPNRLKTAVFAGLGMGMIDGVPGSAAIAEGLLAEDPSKLTDPQAIAFRQFADQTKSDRQALAACIRESRAKISAEDVAKISLPVLVAIGTKDDVAGDLDRFVDILPNATGLPIPNRNHMVAVGDKVYKAGVVNFWSSRTE
ncbi:MAG: alpha/beta hydrolase [Pseudomonadota bacterium]